MQSAAEIMVENELFGLAVRGGDGFRQWFYPKLPKSYAMNPRVAEEIKRRTTPGRDPRTVAQEIYDAVEAGRI